MSEQKLSDQRWAQSSKTHFEIYEKAAEHKATLEGRVKIRRRQNGFDVVTYKKAVKKQEVVE